MTDESNMVAWQESGIVTEWSAAPDGEGWIAYLYEDDPSARVIFWSRETEESLEFVFPEEEK